MTQMSLTPATLDDLEFLVRLLHAVDFWDDEDAPARANARWQPLMLSAARTHGAG
jgi:hypothetical protein